MSELTSLKAKTSTSTTVRTSTETQKQKSVPKGASIISSSIRTETEEIENGFIISKNYDVTYKEKGSDSNNYAYFSKKWYSKTDPLTITLNDKTLSDAFDDDEYKT